ncbi:MAG: 30S ribosomal protein S4 [Elusimicrobia bacterium]|nr:30S ribosomal protein S4 [Elusimicrobiota bacterium]
MARVIGAVCRLCRAEGVKLFLKGTRCYSAKCAVDKKATLPGQQGKRRSFGRSDYKIQLREKQKARRISGLMEKQFRLYFKKADQKKGLTGENLLRLLERRLDNVAFRLGFSTSRPGARQLVAHGGVLVNSKKVDIPSYIVKVGDKVTVSEKRKGNVAVQGGQKVVTERGLPTWLDLNKDSLVGTITKLPDRTELSYPVQEQLIVELYSK